MRQDASEFLLQLFDRLGDELKSLPPPDLGSLLPGVKRARVTSAASTIVEALFGVRDLHVTTCCRCNTRSERIDVAPCVPLALNSGLYWPRRSLMRHPGTIVVEFLDPLPPGLPRKQFREELESRLETASNRLMAEGQAQLENKSEHN